MKNLLKKASLNPTSDNIMDFGRVTTKTYRFSSNILLLIAFVFICSKGIAQEKATLEKTAVDIEKETAVNNNRLITDLRQLDRIAVYPGGIGNFYANVISSLDSSDLDYDDFSRINVSFVIEKDGSMSEIKVNDNIDPLLCKSIVEALKSIKTKWTPAVLNDSPTRFAYQLPIVFK
jgi:periplasmic protein TonB